MWRAHLKIISSIFLNFLYAYRQENRKTDCESPGTPQGPECKGLQRGTKEGNKEQTSLTTNSMEQSFA